MNFVDTSITEPLRNTRLTDEGYLAAEAFAVRSGIQLYRGSEVGMPDFGVVRVYRPADEVFKKDSVASFVHKPLTVDHPKGGVKAETWKDHAVGEVSTEAMRDGERLKLQLVVKDAAAVAKVQDGSRRQLSAGYSCELDKTPGTTEDGQVYDAVQRNIKINHLALVERGRAGNCQIGDSDWGITPLEDASGASPRVNQEVQMDTKTLVMGDAAVKVAAEDADKVTAHVKVLSDAAAAAKTEAETLKGQLAALQQQVKDTEMTPAKLQKLVADRALVASGYKKLTGKDADANMTDADIRKAAVLAKLGDAAKDMSDAAVEGAFAALTAAPAADPLRTAAADGLGQTEMGDTAELFKLAGVPMKKKE